MELGNQIKKYRNELEISQEKLADKIYVSRQSISNWENDNSENNTNSVGPWIGIGSSINKK